MPLLPRAAPPPAVQDAIALPSLFPTTFVPHPYLFGNMSFPPSECGKSPFARSLSHEPIRCPSFSLVQMFPQLPAGATPAGGPSGGRPPPAGGACSFDCRPSRGRLRFWHLRHFLICRRLSHAPFSRAASAGACCAETSARGFNRSASSDGDCFRENISAIAFSRDNLIRIRIYILYDPIVFNRSVGPLHRYRVKREQMRTIETFLANSAPAIPARRTRAGRAGARPPRYFAPYFQALQPVFQSVFVPLRPVPQYEFQALSHARARKEFYLRRLMLQAPL